MLSRGDSEGSFQLCSYRGGVRLSSEREVKDHGPRQAKSLKSGDNPEP